MGYMLLNLTKTEMSMNHLFIINPAAGRGKSMKYVEEIKKYFKKRSDIFIMEFTKRPGHATEIARSYVSRDSFRVYSVGGDGTLNEVLNGMAGSDSVLASIPGGSGNDFIKSLCPEPSFKNILERTVRGKERKIDLAKVNDRYFINISSIGLDADVVYSARKVKKLPGIPGSLAYAAGVFIALFRYRSNPLDINIDGKQFKTDSLLAAVANGRYYGGGMLPAPSAEIDDSYLDLCVIEDKKRIDIIRFLPKFSKGEHTDIEGVKFYRVKNVEITCSKPFSLNIDGEIERNTSAVFEIIPCGVSVVVPEPL
jgi:YegS/Rv2252/BmrU family lipid kinase